MAFLLAAICTVGLLTLGVHVHAAENDSTNDLVATYSDAVLDPWHWLGFYSLPRTAELAKKDGWAVVANATQGLDGLVTTWCRQGDFRVCLLFDAEGVVAGLMASVPKKDFDKEYPVSMETLWRPQTLLKTEVYSATALFVAPNVLMEGGRKLFTDADSTVDVLHLQNGQSFWAMPSRAQDAKRVAFKRQGCVKGMGRHYFYGMTPDQPCDEHRPFFLLFDDETGQLHGFGVTLFGKPSSGSMTGRKWFERLDKLAPKMVPEPNAPACFADWSHKKGLAALHVYFKSSPKTITCKQN